MTKVVCDISTSLDGFITGPNEGVGNPLGDDDGLLHDWRFDAKTAADSEIVDELYAKRAGFEFTLVDHLPAMGAPGWIL